LASNSWMHTPQGHEIIDGRVVPVDWLAVILNPSFPYRLTHMVIAAFLATALMVAGSAAWHMLRGNTNTAVRKMFAMGVGMILVVAPLQAFVGDLHGLNTLQHQPAKIAAMEGHWENVPGEGVPLTLFGWPDEEAETTHFAVKVPNLGSVILTHSWDGQFPGLKEFAPEDRPPVAVVSWTFRIMVGLGLLMILLGVWSLIARLRGTLFESRALHRMALYMGPAGIVAILAGWFTTEIGRQPWVVYNLMRTADAVSPHGVPEMTTSLILFVVVYFIVFGAGTVYVLRLIGLGPVAHEGKQPIEGGPGQERTPARPF